MVRVGILGYSPSILGASSIKYPFSKHPSVTFFRKNILPPLPWEAHRTLVEKLNISIFVILSQLFTPSQLFSDCLCHFCDLAYDISYFSWTIFPRDWKLISLIINNINILRNSNYNGVSKSTRNSYEEIQEWQIGNRYWRWRISFFKNPSRSLKVNLEN